MSRSIRLEQVHIPVPCHADWATMTGDERTRFCTACGKHVHDLSARSRAEGEALLTASDGKLCVQLTLDRRGRPVTRDGPRAWPVVRRVWPVMSVAVAFLFGLTGCRGQVEPPQDGPKPGEMVIRTGDAAEEQVVLGRPAPTTTPTTTPATQPAATKKAATADDPWGTTAGIVSIRPAPEQEDSSCR